MMSAVDTSRYFIELRNLVRYRVTTGLWQAAADLWFTAWNRNPLNRSGLGFAPTIPDMATSSVDMAKSCARE
jgi:hypothetical protein